MPDYEPLDGPNYEAAAFAGWIAAAVVAVWSGTGYGWPRTTLLWAAAGCVALGLRPMWAALGLHRRRATLVRKKIWRLPAARLRRTAEREPLGLYLGRGFPWRPHHAQGARDLAGSGREVDGGVGAAWIHGLGAREEDLHLTAEQASSHMLVLGTTGSGKTRFFELLVCQAVLRGEAVVIIDPKGDRGLREAAERACRAAGSIDRFVHFHPAFPEYSARINPLQNFNRGTELASRVAQLVPAASEGDPFRAYAQMALNHGVQGMLMAGERPTLLRLRRVFEGGLGPLVARALRSHCANAPDGTMPAHGPGRGAKAEAWIRHYRKHVRPGRPSAELDGLVSMYEHDRIHFSKMTASLQPLLNMLTAGPLGTVLSPDPMDPDDGRPLTDSRRIITGRQVAYFGLDSLSDPMVGAAVGSLLLADLASVAGDRYNFGERTPVHLFVDEAAEVMNEPLIQLLNKGRGSGMRVMVAAQSIQDFVARLGNEAKGQQVLANVNHIVAFRILDPSTRDFVADLMPTTRLRHIMLTQGSATDAASLHSGHVGERLMEEEGGLFPAVLLGRLPNLEFVASLAGGEVVKGRIPILDWDG